MTPAPAPAPRPPPLPLQAFERMRRQGCRADGIVYNAIIDTLWETGVVWAQRRALALFRCAARRLCCCFCCCAVRGQHWAWGRAEP